MCVTTMPSQLMLIVMLIMIIMIVVIVIIMIIIGLRRRMAPLRGLSVTAGRSTHPRWRAVAGDKHDDQIIIMMMMIRSVS